MANKRKDGLIERKVTINGKRVSVYGHSVKEIDEKAAKLRQEAEQGIQPSKTMTLDDLEKIWLKGKTKVKPNTIQTYDGLYKAISRHIGKMKIKDIDATTCDQLKASLMTDTFKRGEKGKEYKYTSTGINDRISLLKTIMQYAVTRRLIPYNPCATVESVRHTEPKMRDNVHRALTETELKVFWNEAKNHEHYNLMRFLVSTGMRCGEACALKWGDIQENKVHVCKTTAREKGKLIIHDTPKTDSSNRYVPLGKSALQALDDQKKRSLMLFGAKGCADDTIVFPNPEGSYNDSPTINGSIRYHIGLMNKKGVQFDRFPPNAFRHTFATMCVDQGMQPQVLQKILGHSSLEMTMSLYYHLDEQQKQDAMDKIDIPV